MEKKSIKSGNGAVHYWVGGNINKDSKCVLFTHGMTADHTMFDRQAGYFEKDYEVIVWDVPLHGESRPYKNFSYYNTAQELNRILKAEDLTSVILVGHSMGGYVCQEFAIQYPDKVKAFVGVDTTPFGHYYYAKWERLILSKVGTILSWYPYNMLVKCIAKGNTKTKYAYGNLFTAVSKSSKKEIVEITKVAYKGFLDKEDMASFNFPVLLIIGDGDNTGFVGKYNKMWSEKEGYPLKIVANAAHLSNVDNFEEFNSILAEFLGTL